MKTILCSITQKTMTNTNTSAPADTAIGQTTFTTTVHGALSEPTARADRGRSAADYAVTHM